METTQTPMSDLDLSKLPEGFHYLGNHIVLRGDPQRRIWTLKSYSPTMLSRGELKKATNLGPCFLTPKTGQMGWNVRKSYPFKEALRALPFIIFDGTNFIHCGHRASNGSVAR